MKNLLFAFLAMFTGETEAATTLYEQNLQGNSAISAAYQLFLRGENAGATPATVIVRLDDEQSTDYASRVNEEWVVAPGEFELYLPVATFKTPKKRKLDLTKLKSLKIFTPDEDVVVSDVAWNRPAEFGGSVLALDFGPTGSAVFPGFSPVFGDDPRLSGKLEAVERPYLDSLVADGVRGIENIALPVEPGQYNLTLWTEDIGQWETPPRYIERRIKINGKTMLYEKFSEQDWRQLRYLQNKETQSLPSRGNPLAFQVTVGPTDKGLNIALAGDNKTALFVSGLLLEPLTDVKYRKVVAQIRKERFSALWPVFEDIKQDVVKRHANIEPGGIAILKAGFTPSNDNTVKAVELKLPAGLSGQVRYVQNRLVRPDPQKRALVRSDQTLRGDIVGLALEQGKPQHFHVLIFARQGMSEGDYSGTLTINQHVFDLSVSVRSDHQQKTPVMLRGVYLDHAYYLKNLSERRSQLWCDTAFLRKLGFSTIAPPFSLEVSSFQKDLAFYQSAGFTGPIFVYAALKRWIQKYGLEEAANRVRAVNQSNLIWSIADEPSNPGFASQALAGQIRYLREQIPEVRLAGHLNSAKDVHLVELFDVVLVNDGFAAALEAIPEHVDVWFYNIQKSDGRMSDILSKMKRAKGFLQWHARNPVGDPFDPTDGREGDKSFLLPSAEICATVPDLDAHLLNLVATEE